MIEHLPSSDEDAISLSLAMVDRADIYLGIIGQRYGYIPSENNLNRISIVEMEYNRAVELGIPRFIFLMHADHPVKASEIDRGEALTKLELFENRLKKENLVKFFKSPVDLRTHVIESISNFRQPDLAQFHYISEIPDPPKTYIAHPYTLLQTHDLVGRQPELNLLTKWVTQTDSDVYKAHILSIVAIGGMGKSALTWKWFEDIAPQEMKPLAGRMWWSFYESDASFENFIIRAFAYVSRRPIEEIQKLTPAG